MTDKIDIAAFEAWQRPGLELIGERMRQRPKRIRNTPDFTDGQDDEWDYYD
jgi:hypothetical protein